MITTQSGAKPARTTVLASPDPARIGTKYRPELDGLRAISCLLVYLYHVHGSKRWNGHFPWLVYFQGWIGVYVFFVLSGFLITSLLLWEESSRGKIRMGRFILRREFRIVPAYYATIALYAVLCLTPLARHYASEFHAGLWYWLSHNGDYATRVPAVGTLFGQSWSLAVEQRFYLVYPLIFLFFRSWRIRLGILIAMIAATLVMLTANSISYFSLMVGAMVAIARAYGWGERFVARTPLLLSVGLTAATFVLVWFQWNVLVLFCVAVGILIYQLSMRNGVAKRALSITPLVWLGKRSYSFYLLHVIALNLALKAISSQTTARATAALLLGCGIATCMSAVSYWLIEEPFRKFGKRIATASR